MKIILFILFVIVLFIWKSDAVSWKENLLLELDNLSEEFMQSMQRINFTDNRRIKRSETISSQTVYQFQKKQKKCKNLRSYGIASGSNALSYMSFVASVITLVLNINNNINANNNNNNQANINFGNNNNLVSNLNQNVGNNFNLMFPPGRKRRRRHARTSLDEIFEKVFKKPICKLF